MELEKKTDWANLEQVVEKMRELSDRYYFCLEGPWDRGDKLFTGHWTLRDCRDDTSETFSHVDPAAVLMDVVHDAERDARDKEAQL